MSDTAQAFSLGREGGDDGSFQRQESRFRQWVTADGRSDFPPVAGRYHLYVARACPWAHRTLVGRRLMGLEDAISVSYVNPHRDERGWQFTGGEYADEVNGFDFLSEAYAATEPGFDERVSVPVLWDRETGRIVNNESSEILRMFGTVFAEVAEHPVELYPPALAHDIDRLNDRIYDNLNNAVYKAGFSSRQEVYEHEVAAIFAILDELDARLAGSRFLFGPEPLETDWRAFTTLVRFDAVYYVHFKCSVRKIAEYRYLWPYLRDLYQWPGVAETVDFAEIRAHYYGTHEMINPQRKVAVMPALDFGAPVDERRAL